MNNIDNLFDDAKPIKREQRRLLELNRSSARVPSLATECSQFCVYVLVNKQSDCKQCELFNDVRIFMSFFSGRFFRSRRNVI